MEKIKKVAENTNFTAIDASELINSPASGEKAFLKEILKTTSMEISITELPPQTEIPFFHTHNKNEEVYVILSGEGKFQVDEEYFEISQGSIVRVAPAGKRNMINTSDENMLYIVIQAKEGSLEEYTGTDGNIFEQIPMWNK